eukprot:9262960-Karenia_brevis.AAC.1
MHDIRQRKREAMLNSPHCKAAYGYVAHNFTPPLHVLQRPNASFCTSPSTIDDLLRTSWDKVYSGNSTNHAQLVANYLIKYASLLFVSNAMDLPPITGEDPQDIIPNSDPSAPGLDI